MTKPKAAWTLWFKGKEGWFPFLEMRMLDGSSTPGMINILMTKYFTTSAKSGSVYNDLTHRILPLGRKPK
jgi:hypothetical protein